MEQNRTNFLFVEDFAKDISNREVKSSAFTTFFSNPENAAALYSALEGVDATPEDINIATLEGILFIARKNDLAFTVKNNVLIISEHQSSINENMPLRDAIYYGRTQEKLLSNPKEIYRRKRIMIPTPKFFVFYNGNEPFPSEKVMKLSDSYLEKTDPPMLELIVKVININLPNKHKLLEQCRPLYEYSWFIQKVKDYENMGHNRDAAITQAIRECKREDIMADFMYEHGSEVANMLFGEYDEELAKEVAREEGYEDGKIEGRIEGRIEGEQYKLITLVCKKLQKGKSAMEIAEDLEEELRVIEELIAVMKQVASGNAEEIFKLWKAKGSKK